MLRNNSYYRWFTSQTMMMLFKYLNDMTGRLNLNYNSHQLPVMIASLVLVDLKKFQVLAILEGILVFILILSYN